MEALIRQSKLRRAAGPGGPCGRVGVTLRRGKEIWGKNRHFSLKTTSPRLHTKLANLVKSTIHLAVIHELTSNPSLQKRAISFANLPSLQSGPAVATFLTVTIFSAPTPVVRCRAQKKCTLSRAGRCRVEREVSGTSLVHFLCFSFAAILQVHVFHFELSPGSR